MSGYYGECFCLESLFCIFELFLRARFSKSKASFKPIYFLGRIVLTTHLYPRNLVA